MIRADVWSRLLAKSVVDPITECWIWIGAYVINRRGKRYGRIKIKGRAMLAHRVAFAEARGYPLPKRKQGAHSCDETLCINPAHLRAATPASNQREAYRKGRKKISGAVAQSS